MNITKKLSKIIIYIIEIIFILILSFLFVISIFQTSSVVMGEITKYLFDNPIIHIIAISITIAIFILINNKNLNITKKRLWILIGIWSFISAVWVFLVDLYPRFDQKHVYEIAEQMRNGIFTGFDKGKYAFICSNQLGLILYEFILGLIFKSKNYIALQLINIIALLVVFFCIYKITRMMFKDKNTSIIVIIGLFMFIPIWFYITFVYGNILGLAFSMIALLYALKYLEDRKIKYVAISAISISVAISFKSNYLISLIAILCILMFDIISNKRWKSFIPIITIILTYLIFSNMVPLIIQNITKKETSPGIPMIAYVEMGLQEGKHAPGWYNRYNKKVYIESDCNYDKAVETVKRDLRDSLNKFKQNPKYACEFFYKKTVSQWNNPTFQAFWINWGKRREQERKLILKAITGHNIVNTIISEYMNIIQTLILFGATVFMIINFKKNNIKQLAFAIIFIGGFLFHIIWEAKCQYTITYFILLIPYAIKGYMDLSKIIDKKIKKERCN